VVALGGEKLDAFLIKPSRSLAPWSYPLRNAVLRRSAHVLPPEQERCSR
jgi:hypothetical protein